MPRRKAQAREPLRTRLERKLGELSYDRTLLFRSSQTKRPKGFFEVSVRHRIEFKKLFSGKRLLDVGCGEAGLFVKECVENGIKAEGLDPDISGKDSRLHRSFLEDFNPKEKYSCVISTFGGPHYSPNSFNDRSNIYHMLRLAKPEGIVSIYPYPPKGKPLRTKNKYELKGPFPENLQLTADTPSIIKKLSALGFKLHYKPREIEDRTQGCLVIVKPSEEAVEKLGKALGVTG